MAGAWGWSGNLRSESCSHRGRAGEGPGTSLTTTNTNSKHAVSRTAHDPRRNAPIVAERLGYANVEFRKGRIQDLGLDFEILDAELKKNPIANANTFLRAQELAADLRIKHPLVETESVDVVVSNCVLNLV